MNMVEDVYVMQSAVETAASDMYRADRRVKRTPKYGTDGSVTDAYVDARMDRDAAESRYWDAIEAHKANVAMVFA